MTNDDFKEMGRAAFRLGLERDPYVDFIFKSASSVADGAAQYAAWCVGWDEVSSSTPVTHSLFDLGYNDLKKHTELARIAVYLDAYVADLRFVPNTRNPEFSKTTLSAVLAERYYHFGELGNKNYRGNDVQIVDLETGLPKLHELLQVKPVIIMCACWDRKGCHRMVVAAEYQKAYGLATKPLSRSVIKDILSQVDEIDPLQPKLL